MGSTIGKGLRRRTGGRIPAQPARPRLRWRIERVSALAAPLRAEMWALYERYYTEVDGSLFEADLAQKSHVILLTDRTDGSLQGFSTLASFEPSLGGRQITVVYSGDTIVDRRYWGDPALQIGFLWFTLSRFALRPWRPVYWLLISKGWRTYLLLTRFFGRYWPRWDRETPAPILALMDELAAAQWPDAWQPEKGILHFSRPMGRLREGVAPIEAALLADADIRFFAERNPGHPEGDELVCLGAVGLDLAARSAWRILRRALPGRRRAPKPG